MSVYKRENVCVYVRVRERERDDVYDKKVYKQTERSFGVIAN